MAVDKPYRKFFKKEDLYIESSSSFDEFLYKVKKSMAILDDVLTPRGIDYVILGGTARNEHGVLITTPDIDILVSDSDKSNIDQIFDDRWMKISPYDGSRFRLKPTKEDIDVLYSGTPIGGPDSNMSYPEPADVPRKSDNTDIVDLKFLVFTKLITGKYGIGRGRKDFYHIEELIKQKNLPEDFADSMGDEASEIYRSIWKDVNS